MLDCESRMYDSQCVSFTRVYVSAFMAYYINVVSLAVFVNDVDAVKGPPSAQPPVHEHLKWTSVPHSASIASSAKSIKLCKEPWPPLYEAFKVSSTAAGASCV